jgi:hypothetical protein
MCVAARSRKLEAVLYFVWLLGPSAPETGFTENGATSSYQCATRFTCRVLVGVVEIPALV